MVERRNNENENLWDKAKIIFRDKQSSVFIFMKEERLKINELFNLRSQNNAVNPKKVEGRK